MTIYRRGQTMTTQTPTIVNESTLSKLILKGDISSLSDSEKVQYYHSICERLGLDPLTNPFAYIVMQGKQTLYLNKSGAEQLNKIHNLSMEITDNKTIGDIYVVTARASVNGRLTDSTGAVNIKGLYGDALANAYMKAETKAKRRATISLLGLAMLDETEVETIPGAKTQEAKVEVLGERSKVGETVPSLTSSDEPTMEDWEQVEKLVTDNHFPIAYYRAWRQRDSQKKMTNNELYQAALIKFGQLNKGTVEKDEVMA